MLHVMVESHLKKIKQLFPDKTIIPKQHYLPHLVSAIERFEPSTQVWSMRFEGKHQFIKQRMGGNHNFKNVLKSVAERCIMYETTLNVGEQHPLFSKDLVIGKVKTATDFLTCKLKINAFLGIDTELIKSVHTANWIVLHGQKYVKNQCLNAFR